MDKNSDIPDLMFDSLNQVMRSYAPLSDNTWKKFKTICKHRPLTKGERFTDAGTIPRSFGFVYQGLLRAYINDLKGGEYNKNFFPEGTFPGAMVALLSTSRSRFTIDALEPSELIEIDFQAYRHLLMASDDLKVFHIHYLEKNWLVAKDIREVALVQDNAAERYQRFQSEHPELVERLPQYHIASHLGITPTQLSRIRKIISQ